MASTRSPYQRQTPTTTTTKVARKCKDRGVVCYFQWHGKGQPNALEGLQTREEGVRISFVVGGTSDAGRTLRRSTKWWKMSLGSSWRSNDSCTSTPNSASSTRFLLTCGGIVFDRPFPRPPIERLTTTASDTHDLPHETKKTMRILYVASERRRICLVRHRSPLRWEENSQRSTRSLFLPLSLLLYAPHHPRVHTPVTTGCTASTGTLVETLNPSFTLERRHQHQPPPPPPPASHPPTCHSWSTNAHSAGSLLTPSSTASLNL